MVLAEGLLKLFGAVESAVGGRVVDYYYFPVEFSLGGLLDDVSGWGRRCGIGQCTRSDFGRRDVRATRKTHSLLNVSYSI